MAEVPQNFRKKKSNYTFLTTLLATVSASIIAFLAFDFYSYYEKFRTYKFYFSSFPFIFRKDEVIKIWYSTKGSYLIITNYKDQPVAFFDSHIADPLEIDMKSFYFTDNYYYIPIYCYKNLIKIFALFPFLAINQGYLGNANMENFVSSMVFERLSAFKSEENPKFITLDNIESLISNIKNSYTELIQTNEYNNFTAELKKQKKDRFEMKIFILIVIKLSLEKKDIKTNENYFNEVVNQYTTV
ncbi:MAG: hypothetical protein DA328_04465 [Nitrososphaeraceae archaeon]|nr:hypothetical protein [Nitrososphaeraceae archaeon]